MKIPSGWASRIASARRGAGHDGHLAADLDQVAEDVPLHPEIERDDVRAATACEVLGSRCAVRTGVADPPMQE